MSQSQPLGLGGVAYISTNDLSAAQFKAVVADTANAGSVIVAGSNVVAIGWLQNKPKAGEIAQVFGVRGGSTKMWAGGAISKGDKLQLSSGLVITATGAAQLVVGIAMEASTASGDIIEGFILDSYVA